MVTWLTAQQHEQLFGHGPRSLGSHPPLSRCVQHLVRVRYKPRRCSRARVIEVRLVQQLRRTAMRDACP